MKKSLLGLLLAVALVVPAFAVEKGGMELDVKAGLNIEPLMMEDYYGDYYGYKTETTFSLAADYYYYFMNNLGLGLGVSHIFTNNFNDDNWGKSCKIGSTNIYATVKPVFELSDSIIDKIYFLGQLGYGICGYDAGAGFPQPDKKNGLYWGIGVGVEKNNILLEVLYSISYLNLDFGYGVSHSYSYRNLAVNVGYKFSL